MPERKPYEVDPAAWPQPVDMDKLLSDLCGAFKRYVVLPSHADVVLSLWTIATYAHHFRLTEYAPRVIIKSPDAVSGKSRLLRLLAYLVSRPYEAVDPTAASIYYTVDEHRPTLLFDENEHCALPQKGPLIGVLNSGHAPNGHVPRRINGVTREFATFAFAAIAGIGDLPRTLETRAYIIWMLRKLADEQVDRLDMRRAPPELYALRQQMYRWVGDHAAEIEVADPDTGDLQDRDADSARILLTIADAAGGEWPRRAREAIMALVSENKEISESALLLSDIAAIFNDPVNPVHDFISSDDLVAALGRIEDHDWSLSKKMLANLLKPYRVRPKPVRTPTGTPRGYRRIWFRDAWARYLNIDATSATNETPPVSGVSLVADTTEAPASPTPPPNSGATSATSETQRKRVRKPPPRSALPSEQYKSGDRVWLRFRQHDRQLAEIVAATKRGRFKVRKLNTKTEEWHDSRLPIMAAQIIGFATDVTTLHDRRAAASSKPNGVVHDTEGSGLAGRKYIYAPPGQAGEYAPLTCNPYRGCGHKCAYCYVPHVIHMKRAEFDAGAVDRDDFLKHLIADAERYQRAGITEQVMLSFTSDPYHPGDTTLTRATLEVLRDHGLGFCTLSKGGTRALRDIDLFRPDRDAYAATLTSLDAEFSRKWEKDAALPADRIETLRTFHDRGIFTWVSLEPTLDVDASLAIVEATHSFVDLFKVGRVNYVGGLTKATDWRDYTLRMIDLLGRLRAQHYIKKDLQAYLPAGYPNPLRVPQHH